MKVLKFIKDNFFAMFALIGASIAAIISFSSSAGSQLAFVFGVVTFTVVMTSFVSNIAAVGLVSALIQGIGSLAQIFAELLFTLCEDLPPFGFHPTKMYPLLNFLEHTTVEIGLEAHMAKSEHPPRKSERIWILRFDYGRFRGPRNHPKYESPRL